MAQSAIPNLYDSSSGSAADTLHAQAMLLLPGIRDQIRAMGQEPAGLTLELSDPEGGVILSVALSSDGGVG